MKEVKDEENDDPEKWEGFNQDCYSRTEEERLVRPQ